MAGVSGNRQTLSSTSVVCVVGSSGGSADAVVAAVATDAATTKEKTSKLHLGSSISFGIRDVRGSNVRGSSVDHRRAQRKDLWCAATAWGATAPKGNTSRHLGQWHQGQLCPN